MSRKKWYGILLILEAILYLVSYGSSIVVNYSSQNLNGNTPLFTVSSIFSIWNDYLLGNLENHESAFKCWRIDSCSSPLNYPTTDVFFTTFLPNKSDEHFLCAKYHLFNMDLLAYKECRNEGAFKQLEK